MRIYAGDPGGVAVAHLLGTCCNHSHQWVSCYRVWAHLMPPQVHHSIFYDDCLDAPLCITGVGAGMENVEGEEDLPWDPAGHGATATGNVTKCREFWAFGGLSSAAPW